MTEARLKGLVARLPEGITEIYTHPATSPDFPGAAPGYRYEGELAALVRPDFAARSRQRVLLPAASWGLSASAFGKWWLARLAVD